MGRVVGLLLLSGCVGELIELTPGEAPVAVTVVARAPLTGTPPAMTTVSGMSGSGALWRQGGAVAALASDGGALVWSGSAFTPLPVRAQGQARALGAVRAWAPRGAGVLVVAEGGFFHDAPGGLERAPLSDDFTMSTVALVDVVGGGADEAVWLTTATGAVRVMAAMRQELEVQDPLEPGPVSLVVGRSATRAVLSQGRSLYEVDLGGALPRARTLARDVPPATRFARLDDGTLALATAGGLVTLTPDDVVTRYTLAETGEVAVVDVVSGGDHVLVRTAQRILRFAAPDATEVAAVSGGPLVNGVVADGAGELWFVDGSTLARVGARPPPSFAAEVKGFMRDRCNTCHLTGAGYAPVFDLTSYPVAKARAARIVARLTDGVSPMPPASRETLTPADYEVVIRWFNGGQLP